MQGLSRLILLGIFATVGVAVAVALATAPPVTVVDSDQAAPNPTDTVEHLTDTAEHPADTAEADSFERQWLPYHPSVAQIPSSLQGLEEAIHASQQNNQDVVEQISDLVDLAQDLLREETTEVPVVPEERSLENVPFAPPAESIPPGGVVESIIEDSSLMEFRPADGSQGMVINIQNTDIREVLDLLSQHGGLNILASQSVEGNVSASLQNVDVRTALDAILRSTGYMARRDGPFIYVGTREDFIAMDHSLDEIGTRIYRPNYVNSSEMEQLIAPMLTPEFGSISITSPSQIGMAANSNAAGGDDFTGNEMLLVRDFEVVLHEIDQIVVELDRQPLQVSIEAMILSVRLDDKNSFGVNFEALLDQTNTRLVSGTPPANLAAIDVSSGGLKFGFLNGNLAAFVNALETIGDTNVIASPRIMVLNKQPAEILIGSQLGYVSTTVTENAATQSVEFLEVGTQLRLRPFISSDGLIRMEVHPELSTGTVRIEEGFTLPDKEVTQVTTNVMCRDGATMLIGGLIREDLTSTARQIPLIGRLPYVGPVFRQETETIDRREVIVLITPRIVNLPAAEHEGAHAAHQFHRGQAIYFDKTNPLGTRFYGLRYYRLARASWNAGEACKALRYINLAIHFDPQNHESINLRAEIIANSPYGDVTIDSHLREGLAPWEHPVGGGRHLSPWILEALEAGVPPPSVVNEEYLIESPTPIRSLERLTRP